MFTVLSLATVWIEIFLADENRFMHVLAYFIPASLAIVAALVLAVEVTFLRGIPSRPSTLGP